MPRYYFHVHDGVSLFDRVGSELPDLPAARQEALTRMRDLIGRREDSAWASHDWTLVICDESGEEVLRLDIKREPGCH